MSDEVFQRAWILVGCLLAIGVGLMIWPEHHAVIGGVTMIVGAFWLGFEIGLQWRTAE